MADTLEQFACFLKPRWKEHEILMARSLDYKIDDYQLEQDWCNIISLANQPGASLEQAHIFALCHIFRRPIIVYSVKYVKSFRGENIGFTHFEGVYLPLIWEPSFCFKSPIALGYTRGHFTALVPLDRSEIYTYVYQPTATTTSTQPPQSQPQAASSGAMAASGISQPSPLVMTPTAAVVVNGETEASCCSLGGGNSVNESNGEAINNNLNSGIIMANENSEKVGGSGQVCGSVSGGGGSGAVAAMATASTSGAGAVSASTSDQQSGNQQVFYLPLTNSEGQLLPVHFLTHQEV